MIWVGLLMVGLGVADLGHSLLRVRWVPEIVAAAVTVVLGLLAGYSDARSYVFIAVIAILVLAWGSAVRYGFGRRIPWLPLGLLVLALVVTLALSAYGGVGAGQLGRWLAATHFPPLAGVTPQRAILLLGGFLVQASTANVIVRLVLLATHTINPENAEAREIGPRTDAGSPRLKGGRLLGPMERMLILGFGVSGALTAAGVVVAAKGLIRFPELSASRRSADEPPIESITEYFLVGSFLSWMVALGTLVLVGR